MIDYKDIEYISYSTTKIFSVDASEIDISHNVQEYNDKYRLQFGGIDISDLTNEINDKILFKNKD